LGLSYQYFSFLLPVTMTPCSVATCMPPALLFETSKTIALVFHADWKCRGKIHFQS
jgi:hypothetical protein